MLPLYDPRGIKKKPPNGMAVPNSGKQKSVSDILPQKNQNVK